MGSDATIYLFDYLRFQSEVVPAFQRLLLKGTLEPWLPTRPDRSYMGVDARFLHYVQQHPTDLVRFCHYLTNDFAFPGFRPPRPWSALIDWEARQCPSKTCPERQRCLFHILQAPARDTLVWEFNVLFERAVSVRCLGASQFVGRSVTPYWYDELLRRLQVPDEHPLLHLLHQLGSRGLVVGYQFGDYEGIHGWLTPLETEQLAQHLAHLPLPEYEPSFAALEQFRKSMPGQQGGVFYEGTEEGPFEELSLSFVRTVATIATTRKLGLLWGVTSCHHLQTQALAKVL